MWAIIYFLEFQNIKDLSKHSTSTTKTYDDIFCMFSKLKNIYNCQLSVTVYKSPYFPSPKANIYPYEAQELFGIYNTQNIPS